MRRLRLLLVLALMATGCGTETGSTSSSTTTPGRPHTARTWYDARYADASGTAVVLTYLKPTGEGCEERPVTVLHPTGTDVRAEVRVEEPWAPPTCDVVPAEIELDLGEPLGGRRLLTSGSDTAFVDRDGALVLDAASTPCGRADCSTPSPDPAPCGDEAAASAIRAEIDGADPGGTVVGCDGSFLVVDLTVGAGGCPPNQREACARPKRAYFVARAGSWRLVTYSRDMTCEDVFRGSAIRVAAAVCPGG